MQQILYRNVVNCTEKFKLNQRVYAKKYKELVSGKEPENNNEKNINNFLMTDNSFLVLQRRDNEMTFFH